MNTLQFILMSIIALIQIYIVILEMFLWTKPKGIHTFGLRNKEFAKETKVLGANQGLYNGFLVAGAIWSIVSEKTDVAVFIAICVMIVGIYGGYSTKKVRIFIAQSIPAMLALTSLLI